MHVMATYLREIAPGNIVVVKLDVHVGEVAPADEDTRAVLDKVNEITERIDGAAASNNNQLAAGEYQFP